MLYKAQQQRLAASYKAVMRVRKREQREKGESLSATSAAAAMDPDPVVMLIVSLLATTSVADNRITLTNRASSQNNVSTLFGPTRFELMRRDGKWDKENRSSSGRCSGIGRPKSESKAEPLSLKRKSQLKENTAYPLWL